jgi:hypothetical protein
MKMLFLGTLVPACIFYLYVLLKLYKEQMILRAAKMQASQSITYFPQRLRSSDVAQPEGTRVGRDTVIAFTDRPYAKRAPLYTRRPLRIAHR